MIRHDFSPLVHSYEVPNTHTHTHTLILHAYGVSLLTRLGLDDPNIESRQGWEIYLLSKTARSAPGLT